MFKYWRHRMATVSLFLVFGAACFIGGRLTGRTDVRRLYGKWVPVRIWGGAPNIATRLGRYEITIFREPPQRIRAALPGGEMATFHARDEAKGIGRMPPERGALTVVVAEPAMHNRMLFFGFWPRGRLDLPQSYISTMSPVMPTRGNSWTLLGFSSGLAIKTVAEGGKLAMYYHLGSHWVPANRIRQLGRPRGTTLVWRGEHYRFNPRAGKWLRAGGGARTAPAARAGKPGGKGK